MKTEHHNQYLQDGTVGVFIACSLHGCIITVVRSGDTATRSDTHQKATMMMILAQIIAVVVVIPAVMKSQVKHVDVLYCV